MADQGARPGNDQGAIRVQLSLLSAEDSAAARQLADSIGQIAKMFDAMKASDFRDSANKMAQLHAKMVADTERLQQQQRQQAQSGGASTIEKVRAFLGRSGGGRESGDIATDLSREHALQSRDKAADEEKERRQRERERLDSLTDEQRLADRHRRQSGMPGIGTSEDDPRAFYNRVDPLAGEETGFRIPRFGELNIQDYINLARDRAIKTASAGRASGNINPRAEDAAIMLQKASNLAGYGYAARNLFQRANAFASSQGFSPAAMDAAGATLGFRRDSNPFSDIFGMQTPFSAAGQEGFRQSMDIQKLRFSAGINKQQAAQIVQASAAAGFSGDQRSDVANQFMGPLFRQFQVNPQALIPFTQTLRTGTATIGDLSRELSDLGETARAARTDVNTMAQALSQSGEAAQAAGGYYMSGVQFGRNFATSTGLMPNTGNQLLQQPMVQAMLAGSTGLPSFAQAAAPTSAKIGAIRSSLQMYYNAFSGALGTRGQRVAIRDAQGAVMGYDEGANPAMVAAGSQLGLDADQAEKLLKGQDTGSRISTAQSVLDAYEQRYKGMDPSGGTSAAARRWLHQNNLRLNPTTGQVEHMDTPRRSSLRGPSNRGGTGTWQADPEATKHFQQMFDSPALAQLSKPSGRNIGLDDVIHSAHQAGIRGKALGDAIKGKTIDDQVKGVRKLISEKAAEDQAKYEIAFTGPAAKFFKALAKKTGLEQQYADLPSNIAAASSQGPSPLSDMGNTGLAGP